MSKKTDRDLQRASTLIRDKQYEQARALLKKIDHPTAHQWLVKLDQIAPAPSKKRHPLRNALIGVTVFICGSCVCLAALASGDPEDDDRESEVRRSEPTLDLTIQAHLDATATIIALTPSNTPTATFTPSQTPVPSDTPSPSNTPTASDTPLPSDTPPPSNTPAPIATRTLYEEQAAQIVRDLRDTDISDSHLRATAGTTDEVANLTIFMQKSEEGREELLRQIRKDFARLICDLRKAGYTRIELTGLGRYNNTEEEVVSLMFEGNALEEVDCDHLGQEDILRIASEIELNAGRLGDHPVIEILLARRLDHEVMGILDCPVVAILGDAPDYTVSAECQVQSGYRTQQTAEALFQTSLTELASSSVDFSVILDDGSRATDFSRFTYNDQWNVTNLTLSGSSSGGQSSEPTKAPSLNVNRASGTLYIVGVDTVNVRSGPGTNYNRIGSLAAGTAITLTGEYNGWYRFRFGGGEGWVTGDYTSPNHPSVSNPNPSNPNPPAASGGNSCPSNCDGARAMGLSPEQAAACGLDRDHDGVACYGD